MARATEAAGRGASGAQVRDQQCVRGLGRYAAERIQRQRGALMNVLGVNAFHGDSSAALLCDGVLVAAVEEERFNRINHWAGFPAQAAKWCLSVQAATDLNHLAISRKPGAHIWAKLRTTVAHS